MAEKKAYIKPFLLSIIIVVLDQISKLWIIKNVPENTIMYSWGNDFLWICHVRNTGAAFSLGASGSDFARLLFFIIGPLVVMGFIAWAIASKKETLTKVQRWFAAGILGGGLGTIFDRVFRFSEGVVDFISVKFFGIFGLDRWPTFNVSDSCVVIFVILFLITVLFGGKDGKK